ncbi:MAG: hypothetical protein WC058_13535 [Phycisphaeraceae bacterium]
MKTSTEQPLTPGILILEHPGQLSEGELNKLSGLCGSRLGNRAPKFCAWLGALAADEHNRRESEETAEPIEPRLPDLNCSRWPDGELCDSLIASWIALQIIDPAAMPHLHKLLGQIHFVLLSWNSARFCARRD